MCDKQEVSVRDLSRCYNVSDELYHRLSLYYGMPDSHLWVLYSLYFGGRPCTPKELAETWFLPKQTVHSALKALQQGGYLTMQRSEENGRNRLIVLTEEGMELAARVIEPVIAAEERAFGCLGKEEQRQLIGLMDRYNRALREELEGLMNSHAEKGV